MSQSELHRGVGVEVDYSNDVKTDNQTCDWSEMASYMRFKSNVATLTKHNGKSLDAEQLPSWRN